MCKRLDQQMSTRVGQCQITRPVSVDVWERHRVAELQATIDILDAAKHDIHKSGGVAMQCHKAARSAELTRSRPRAPDLAKRLPRGGEGLQAIFSQIEHQHTFIRQHAHGGDSGVLVTGGPDGRTEGGHPGGRQNRER